MSPVYSSAESDRKESEVAAGLARLWKVRLVKLGKFHVIDFRVEDLSGKIRGFVELKCRSVASDEYRELYLPVLKYDALMDARAKWGVRARFVWSFSDSVRGIEVGSVDTSRRGLGGNSARIGTLGSRWQEDMILVPVASMELLLTRERK